MGVVWFGFGLMLVASVVGWALEKLGIMEVPAPSSKVRSMVAGSSRRYGARARS